MTDAVDLSRSAIAARRDAKAATGRDGGWTARELVGVAASVYDEATRLRKLADTRGRQAVKDRATRALVTAATQIRIAERCPTLDRPYLHALDLPEIQKIKAGVVRDLAGGIDAIRADLEREGVTGDRDAVAELVVDTSRRLRRQRNRINGRGTA